MRLKIIIKVSILKSKMKLRPARKTKFTDEPQYRVLLDYPTRQYICYQGNPLKSLPHIFEHGKEPLFLCDILQRNIDIAKNAEQYRVKEWELENGKENKWNECNGIPHYWMSPGFECGDLLLRHPSGKGKIVSYSPDAIEILKLMRPGKDIKEVKLHIKEYSSEEGRNKEGIYKRKRVCLTQEHYDRVQGLELSKKEISDLDNIPYSIQEACRNPIWQYLAGGRERLKEYYELCITPEIQEQNKYFKNKKEMHHNWPLTLNFGYAKEQITAAFWSTRFHHLYLHAVGHLDNPHGSFIGANPNKHITREPIK